MSSVSNVNVNILNHVLARDMRLKKSQKASASADGSTRSGVEPATSDKSSPMRAAQASKRQLLQNINEGVSMLQTADEQMSVTQRILSRMKEIVEEGTKGQIDGGGNVTVKSGLRDLAESIQEILNNTAFKGISLFNSKEPVLVYIGNGFSIDILEGQVVFDFAKMLTDQNLLSNQLDQMVRQVKDYRESIKTNEGALAAAADSMAKEITDSPGGDYQINNLGTAKNTAKEMSDNTVRKASMFVSMHEGISSSIALNLLQ